MAKMSKTAPHGITKKMKRALTSKALTLHRALDLRASLYVSHGVKLTVAQAKQMLQREAK